MPSTLPFNIPPIAFVQDNTESEWSLSYFPFKASSFSSSPHNWHLSWAHLQYWQPGQPGIISSFWRVRGLPPTWWWGTRGYVCEFSKATDFLRLWALTLTVRGHLQVALEMGHQVSHHLSMLQIAEDVPASYTLTICVSQEVSPQKREAVSPPTLQMHEMKINKEHLSIRPNFLYHTCLWISSHGPSQWGQSGKHLTKHHRWRRGNIREVRERNCSSVCPEVWKGGETQQARCNPANQLQTGLKAQQHEPSDAVASPPLWATRLKQSTSMREAWAWFTHSSSMSPTWERDLLQRLGWVVEKYSSCLSPAPFLEREICHGPASVSMLVSTATSLTPLWNRSSLLSNGLQRLWKRKNLQEQVSPLIQIVLA